jgi:hypothetical protein
MRPAAGINHGVNVPSPMTAFSLIRKLIPAILLMPATLMPQVIDIRDARTSVSVEKLQPAPVLPSAKLTATSAGEVALLPGLFRERRELTKAYLLRLKSDDLLQNHLLEAGVRIDKPYEQMHQGWESPHCQLRGHFAGHWLSAVAHFAAIDHDPQLSARAVDVVRGLDRCQTLNGGQWVGSIPEKYFAILAAGKEPIWSPQYTVHKTLMGLFDAYRYGGDKEALATVERSADWFLAWTDQCLREGRGEAIYGGECSGMLELWADLYGATGDARFLTLASRYAMPDLFRRLLAGADPLSNNHANASIPWIQGAARLYEVTGDVRYREVVERFWQQAVEQRGMFASTGANAGEYWIPSGQMGRFLGSRTQEHCTVYNMIRVAQYLLRWTGEARYADYIERALYNGVLAQQNPFTGAVAYFLPLQPGARKQWGTETHDFWCCHGTMVQAQAMFEDLIYYRTADGVNVSQFIPSEAAWGEAGHRIRISQRNDDTASAAGFSNDATTAASATTGNFSSTGDTTYFGVVLHIAADHPAKWTLRIRKPAWALETGTVIVDGAALAAQPAASGFIEIEREWKDSTVTVTFAKRLTREPLPGDPTRFALLDGPVVLAAITASEPVMAPADVVTPQYEHQYVAGREWQSGHFLASTRLGTVALKPLYEVADEPYCAYLRAE